MEMRFDLGLGLSSRYGCNSGSTSKMDPLFCLSIDLYSGSSSMSLVERWKELRLRMS